MSARDSAYLVPVGLRGENKKAPQQRRGKRREGRGGGGGSKDSFLANLWPKTGTQIQHEKGEICKVASALCKRSSTTNSLSAWFIIPHTAPMTSHDRAPLFILMMPPCNNALSRAVDFGRVCTGLIGKLVSGV